MGKSDFGEVLIVFIIGCSCFGQAWACFTHHRLKMPVFGGFEAGLETYQAPMVERLGDGAFLTGHTTQTLQHRTNRLISIYVRISGSQLKMPDPNADSYACKHASSVPALTIQSCTPCPQTYTSYRYIPAPIQMPCTFRYEGGFMVLLIIFAA